MELIREAIKTVPAVKWGLGVIGLAAMVLLIYPYITNYTYVVFGTAILLAFMFILLVFAKAAKNFNEMPKLFSQVLTASVSLIFISNLTLLGTSYFFCWPRSLGNCQPMTVIVPTPSPIPSTSITAVPSPTPHDNLQISSEPAPSTPRIKKRYRPTQPTSEGSTQVFNNSPGGIQAGRDIIINGVKQKK